MTLLPYVMVEDKGYYSSTATSSNEGHHGISVVPNLPVEDKRSCQQNIREVYSYALADLDGTL